jgi:hypothetical protein
MRMEEKSKRRNLSRTRKMAKWQNNYQFLEYPAS